MFFYKILLSYDGSRYFGWQKSKEGPTIEATLEEALSCYCKVKTVVEGASRTDRGVHALGQVARFSSPFAIDRSPFLKEMRDLLPDDLSIWEIERVEPSFHPSLSAVEKTYEYRIYSGPISSPFFQKNAWYLPGTLDESLIQQSIPLLLGEKNFTPLSCKKKGLERDPHCFLFDIQFTREDPLVKIEITGNRFLYKMARCIAGTLAYVGLRKIPIDTLASSLENPHSTLGVTAPAHALWLKRIVY